MAYQLTRREFLKMAAAGSGLLFFRPKRALARRPRGEHALEGGYEWRYNICTMCASGCGIRAAVKQQDGLERVVKIEGNPYDPFNRGKICARGQAGVRRHHSPNRIKQPLIRVEGSKRGAWKFRPATWEEAYGYIISKLKENKIQLYEMALVGGWITCVYYTPFVISFALAGGIPNIIGIPLQRCCLGGHFGEDTVTGNFLVHGEVMADYANAKYILALRSSSGVAGISTGRAVSLGEALRNKAKLVVIDPRMSEFAAKADEWHPIKPGTDQALLLVILNRILSHERYDADFVKKHTNVPFLAYEEGGWVRLAQEPGPNGQIGKFFVYDRKSEEIRAVPAPSNSNDHDTEGNPLFPALEAPEELEWEGRKVKTVFQLLKEKVKGYTPEWAAPICDLPAATIDRIAEELTTTRPALIEPGWHDPRYANNVMTWKTAAMIQTLLGGIDTIGGWVFSGAYREEVESFWKTVWAGKEPVMAPGLLLVRTLMERFFTNPKAWSHGHPALSSVWSEQQWEQGKDGVAFPLFSDVGYLEAAKGKLNYGGKPYKLRAFFLIAANMVSSLVSNHDWKELFTDPEVKLIVDVDILPSETGLYADVILPDLSYLEREDPLFAVEMAHDLAFTTRDPVKPLVDGKGFLDLTADMAEGLGFYERYLGTIAHLFGWDPQRFTEMVTEARRKGISVGRVARDFALEGLAKRLGRGKEELARELKERGIIHLKGGEEYRREAGIPFKYPAPTPSGRLELYSLIMAEFNEQHGYKTNWDPLIAFVPPEWKPGMRPQDKLSDDEFFFSYGKTPLMSHTSTQGNDLLLSLTELRREQNLGVWIHPQRARRLGIKAGDLVELENTVSGQRVQGVAFLTELIRPDTLFIASDFGREYGRKEPLGVALGDLIPYRLEPVVGSFRTCEFTIKVRKV